MSATPTDGLGSIPLAQLFTIALKTSTGHDDDGMSFSFSDDSTGITMDTYVNFKSDGNKIAAAKGNTWLHVGAEAGCEQMIRGFISKGGKELDVDIRNQEDKTPLMIAVAHGRQTIVGILLAHGADINACIRVKSPECFVGTTALRIAAEKGDIEMVELLLKNEASIAEDANGLTPLDYVLGKGCIGVIRKLIGAGCCPHHVLAINGYNALHCAISNPDPDVVRMLITEYHVNINHRNSTGRTPLSFVKSSDVVKLFLENGAEVDRSILHKRWLKDLESLKLLLQHGAEVDDILFDLISLSRWDRVIFLLENGKISQEVSIEGVFEAFVNHIVEEEDISVVDTLKITKLFLEKGGRITSNIKQGYERYFYVHGSNYRASGYPYESYEEYPEFQELKKLVEANSPSLVEAKPPKCVIS